MKKAFGLGHLFLITPPDKGFVRQKITAVCKSAFILVLCAFLCGCNVKVSQSSPPLETKPYITEQHVNSVKSLTIYAYNEKTTRLESNIVQVTIYPDQTKAEAALSYLLSTPEFEFALNSYGVPDYTLSIAGGIAKVHISNEFPGADNYKRFALHFSIVNTLCSIDGINWVSVYAGDRELAGNAYIGPSRFLETNISDHYIEYYGSVVQKNISAQYPVVLYFGDKSQSRIVPEQHQIYTNIEEHAATINSVLEKMSRQPTDSSDLVSAIASGANINKMTVNGKSMSIDFDKSPCAPSINNQIISYAALYNTITDIYPGIEEIEFTVEGSGITINGNEISIVTEDSFPGIVGTAVTLYMAQEPMDTLYPVNRYLSASSGISLLQIMEALESGPAYYDSDALISPILGELSMDNLISARVVNDVAILNFDSGFYSCVKNMSKQEETIMVYGIVNTLTSREQISRVQFLINNQSFETINGHIYYSQPLFPNPGIIINQ